MWIVSVHAGICGMGIYAIMLPSSGFSVAHCHTVVSCLNILKWKIVSYQMLSLFSLVRVQDVRTHLPERRRHGQGQPHLAFFRGHAQSVWRSTSLAVPSESDADAAGSEPARPCGGGLPPGPVKLLLQAADVGHEHRQRVPTVHAAEPAGQPITRLRQGGRGFYQSRGRLLRFKVDSMGSVSCLNLTSNVCYLKVSQNLILTKNDIQPFGAKVLDDIENQFPTCLSI